MSSSSTKRVALYARVSTSNGQQDPEMQLRELREYARLRDLAVVGEYIDKMTGSKDSRPALNRLMADASQRKFDAVLVWKIDRWGRSLKHLVTSLAELDAYGVAFVSLRDSLDLSTPSGRLKLLGAMAEFERSLIQERVKAGLRNARAKGKKLGRPRAPVDESQVTSLRDSGRPGAQSPKARSEHGHGPPSLTAPCQKRLRALFERQSGRALYLSAPTAERGAAEGGNSGVTRVR